jgi:hypothetical protein
MTFSFLKTGITFFFLLVPIREITSGKLFIPRNRLQDGKEKMVMLGTAIHSGSRFLAAAAC